MSSTRTRVVVAEDVPLIRHAIVALIGLEPDLEVVAQVERGDHVLGSVLEHRPDVLLVDIDLPGLDGLSAARQVHERLPGTRTLVLTGYGQPAVLLRALESHVRGFIVKDARSDTLVASIRRVAAGERVIDADLVAAALETGSSPLTDREADVLRAASTGLSTEQIGADLHLSPTTVRNYLSNAIGKVGGRNRIDTIRICENAGWI